MKNKTDVENETFADIDTALLTQEERDFLADVDWVFNAEPVKLLDGTEFQKSDVDLLTQVSEYFDSIGGKVIRNDIGPVILNRRSAKNSIAHWIGRVKAAAFKAVPEVIVYGRVVERQRDWKGRGYDTHIINAPVVIGGIDYIAEVIVEQSKDGRSTFYLHEVERKEKARSVFKTATERGTPQAKEDVFKTATERGTPQDSRLVIGKKLHTLIRKYRPTLII